MSNGPFDICCKSREVTSCLQHTRTSTHGHRHRHRHRHGHGQKRTRGILVRVRGHSDCRGITSSRADTPEPRPKLTHPGEAVVLLDSCILQFDLIAKHDKPQGALLMLSLGAQAVRVGWVGRCRPGVLRKQKQVRA